MTNQPDHTEPEVPTEPEQMPDPADTSEIPRPTEVPVPTDSPTPDSDSIPPSPPFPPGSETTPPGGGQPPPDDNGPPPSEGYGPPPYHAALGPRRLYRNPNSSLGGVLSGLGQYFGVDESLLKLVFVALVFLTGGAFLLAYLLAWIVVPASPTWPPAEQDAPFSVAPSITPPKFFGALLVVLGAVFALNALPIQGGSTVLVALGLIGGGVWLLTLGQDKTDSAGPVSPPAPATFTPPPVTSVDDQTSEAPWAASGYRGVGAHATQEPVVPAPPQRRRRRWLRRMVIAAIVGFMLLILLVPVVVFFIYINASNQVAIDQTPTQGSEFPLDINEDFGEISIDLREFDFDADGLELPLEVNADLDAGKIEIYLPDEVPASIDADAGIGSVRIYHQLEEGFGPDLRYDDPDPLIELDLSVGAGAVEIRE